MIEMKLLYYIYLYIYYYIYYIYLHIYNSTSYSLEENLLAGACAHEREKSGKNTAVQFIFAKSRQTISSVNDNSAMVAQIVSQRINS